MLAVVTAALTGLAGLASPWRTAVPAYAALRVKFTSILALFLGEATNLTQLARPVGPATCALAGSAVQHATVAVRLHTTACGLVPSVPWPHRVHACACLLVNNTAVLARATFLVSPVARFEVLARVAQLATPRVMTMYALAATV